MNITKTQLSLMLAGAFVLGLTPLAVSFEAKPYGMDLVEITPRGVQSVVDTNLSGDDCSSAMGRLEENSGPTNYMCLAPVDWKNLDMAAVAE